MFKSEDKVIYKSHPEYGVGTILCAYKGRDCYDVMMEGKLLMYVEGAELMDCNTIKFENGSTIRPLKDNNNTYRFSGLGFTSDYKFIDEFDPDDINKFFKNTTNKGDFNMPNITNYKYTEDTAVTTIEWSDGTKTTVRAEYPDTASPYTGFVTACAKKAFGNNNTINKLFDEWAVKKTEREMKAKIKANASELEAKRIAEKRKAKREKWVIRKRAAEINREYEARKLANEKYGVPIDEKKGE